MQNKHPKTTEPGCSLQRLVGRMDVVMVFKNRTAAVKYAKTQVPLIKPWCTADAKPITATYAKLLRLFE
jgi:hypothetical protein